MKINFETLYKEQYPKLYTLAFRISGSKEAAEDILQTSFLNAYKAFDKFREQSLLSTWLYRIVVNTAKKEYAKERKLPITIYAETHDISEDAVYEHISSYGKVEDEALESLVRESCLQMFMNCMPAKYRAVYTLRVILHFSIKESAQILELTESAVKVNLHRARIIVAKHMSGRCSLIKEGAPCDCRSYAKYLVETNRSGYLVDIDVVRNHEVAAQKQFKKEIAEIWKIEDLYNTQIKPIDYQQFLEKIKLLRKEKNLTILEL